MYEKTIIFCIFISFIIFEMLVHRRLQPKKASKRDFIVELLSTVSIIIISIPLIFALSAWLLDYLFPTSKNVLAYLSWPMMLLILLFADDMVQYWWHRACHTPLLYGLHRPHHSAEYMSVRLVYRNNIFYYVFMPNLWTTAILVHLGFFKIYPIYLIVKMTIISLAHLNVPWDKKLYEIKWLAPVMWIVERTISTPSTHHAHHGMHKEDGITHYKGNYGNLLFFWDILFGTAKISRQYPKKFGIENLPTISLAQELTWPLIRSGSNQVNNTKSAAIANKEQGDNNVKSQ